MMLTVRHHALISGASCLRFCWPKQRLWRYFFPLVGYAAAGMVYAQAIALPPFSTSQLEAPPADWRFAGLPGQAKSSTSKNPGIVGSPATQFDITLIDNQKVLRVQTDSSYGNLVHALPGVVLAPGTQLRWRWRLDKPLVNADLRQKRGDDAPLKVCLLFDVPLDKLGFVDRSVLAFGREIGSEGLPALDGVLVGADSDNAGGQSLAYVGDITLGP